ncbi:unnamed protein product [Didymodactylos carnosus]|uniref:Bulb-type lectin domain-containing protein n=1 Tax=Didymodactylos carnosus TaxID=1234261 RepID=A0A814PER8_9BILA|nr:unnamed protein product [Didymodactylos carnosus]CAF3871556.1 unnamed protein product [Didymodactylos carnosus]
MISATAGKCGGAGSSGDVSYYCEPTMHISVFIHESAHSTDRGTSASNNWCDAVEQDSCVPDGYANSNYADNFAQVVVLWVHLIGRGHSKDFGGGQFACMRNQLRHIDTVLPAWRIQERDTLRSGQQLERKEGLTSQNGAYRLVMQDDGNLVLYVSDKDVPANALWTTGTFSKGPHHFIVQRDGNLAIYDGEHRSAWASNTSRQDADQGRLVLQDDGNLVFYDNSNQAVWASNTCCFISPRE